MRKILFNLVFLLAVLVTMTRVEAQADQAVVKKPIQIRAIVNNGKVELKCCLKLDPPFTIERSFDGESWSPIGKIQNRPDNTGNLFIDTIPVMGLSFYRVVCTQPYPGRSNTISVVLDNYSYSVKPNLMNDKMTICNKEAGTRDVSIQIVDLNWELKKTIKTTLSDQPFELDLAAMQKGTYILMLRDGKKTYAYKLFVLKRDLNAKYDSTQ